MNQKVYNYVYFIHMILIIIIFVAFNLSDFWQIIIGAYAIILTSIFTYSNRDAISRTKRKTNNR